MIFHLLIVDDEAATRRGLSCFFDWGSIDCDVAATACDGAEAIEIIKSTPVDIVITDVKMPVTDGLELARYIYENHPQIAVIILTGYAEFEYARTAIRYNVSSLYYKVVVFNDPLQGRVLHWKGCCGLVYSSYRKTVQERFRPQPLAVLLIS